MRKGAPRIAVDAFSRGRWYPNTPRGGGQLTRRQGEVYLSWATQGRECAIFNRHECAIFVRR